MYSSHLNLPIFVYMGMSTYVQPDAENALIKRYQVLFLQEVWPDLIIENMEDIFLDNRGSQKAGLCLGNPSFSWVDIDWDSQLCGPSQSQLVGKGHGALKMVWPQK